MPTEQLDTVKDSAIENADKAGSNNTVEVFTPNEKKSLMCVIRNGVRFNIERMKLKNDDNGLTKSTYSIDIDDENIGRLSEFLGVDASRVLAAALKKFFWDRRNNPKWRELGDEGFIEWIKEDSLLPERPTKSGKVSITKVRKVRMETIRKIMPSLTDEEVLARAIEMEEEEKASKKSKEDKKKESAEVEAPKPEDNFEEPEGLGEEDIEGLN